MVTQQAGMATPPEELERRLLDPRIAKTELEHYAARRLSEMLSLHLLDEYHEDYGCALWWTLPIEEPPYCGSPLDSDWPDYHTHWSRLPQPKQEAI